MWYTIAPQVFGGHSNAVTSTSPQIATAPPAIAFNPTSSPAKLSSSGAASPEFPASFRFTAIIHATAAAAIPSHANADPARVTIPNALSPSVIPHTQVRQATAAASGASRHSQ